MPFSLPIPQSDNPNFVVNLSVGEILYVLGPNGVGKSRLMQLFYAHFPNTTLRISAHRQNWFTNSSVSITAASRLSSLGAQRNQDISVDSAWTEYQPEVRINIALYDLVAAENNRARIIAKAFEEGNLDEAAKFKEELQPPVKTINELLRLSNLPIVISILEDGQIVASKSGGPSYAINKLSDGERNALIIIASVLTAQKESLILIDEPERHLHHSISSPLLSLLIAKRPDCAFIVSTHDIMLPINSDNANIMLIRGCEFQGDSVRAWDADILPSNTTIDEQTKEDILGSRRKMLFIEGTSQSLDTPLYSLVFPEVSIVPKESCRDVEKFVTAIRQEENIHWVKAFGIIDGDGRMQADIDQLKTQGVYALPFYSVEAIYYHPEIQRRIAERQAAMLAGDPAIYLKQAETTALDAVRAQIRHLSQRISERAVREEIFKNLPTRATIVAAIPVVINIDVVTAIQDEETRLNDFLAANDLLSILKRYPIRETGAINAIVRSLQFTSRANYESAVIKLLGENEEALNFVKSLFDTLPTDIHR
ncbi:AAA ATPase [Chitinophaga pinensis DSM 2588]|uniref:AAA ATPase n=2 Tax=Chitinophaga pinensis TaxID=79329 RepID=A0A979GAH6_CHIPD|nr:AAA ATPase [Chitinophaga pinensis DSM 2588]